DTTLRAFDASLERLGLETIDLYLIHWPSPAKDLYVETWQTLEELYRDGRVGAIGVSNFNIEHLQRLIDECEIVPTVNQVKLDPQFQQRALRAFHDEHDIRTEAWAPLGQGSPLLDDDVVVEIARAHDVDAGQIALRWSVQHGIVVIPKSVTPSRIRSNLDVFSFDLTDDEMTRLDGLYQDDRAFDPADMNF
ncbi:MAG: aldo/keto reductase, partial [Acidimicrobiia bacterium]